MDTSQYKLLPSNDVVVVICLLCMDPVGFPRNVHDALGMITRHDWRLHATSLALTVPAQ